MSHRKADSRLALSQPIPRAAARGAGLVRSTGRPLAGLLRAPLRGLASRYDNLRPAPQVDTWSAPLIEYRIRPVRDARCPRQPISGLPALDWPGLRPPSVQARAAIAICPGRGA